MDPKTRTEILAAVEARQDEVVTFLQSLIQHDSVTGNESSIQASIARTLDGLGLTVDQFEPDPSALRHFPGFVEPEKPFAGRPNVVGVWKGRGGGRSILLNGHVDTVPLEPINEWVLGPLSGVVADGRVWGRGASDMKGGVAAMTMAVSILRAMGFQPHGDITLEYVVDEERTGLGTLACVHRGYTADAGICCETSDLEVMPACIGRMWFTIHLRGKPAGISARWEGVSAIDKAIKLVAAVEDLEAMRIEDLRHSLYPNNRGALPCAVTMFHSGTFPSITPERATLRGSMGLMPYEDPAHVEAQLREQIMRICIADPWLRNNPPELTTAGGYVAAGAEISANHPIVETVRRSFQAVTTREPVLSGRMGASDTRFLIREGHTPTVIFGPGVTSQMHAMNEYVPVDNLVIATKVIALAIYDWCNQSR
ncbi:MAG: ArgE/DapE family deacylase [Acidobacteria bacterium]|nr:ArgE/DapE family deacylase [Acidobacteriota bacterium]